MKIPRQAGIAVIFVGILICIYFFPVSQPANPDKFSEDIIKHGRMWMELGEGIDRQIVQTRSDLGKLNEQKRLKSLGEELKHVSAKAFLVSTKLNMSTPELRQQVEINLSHTVRIAQQEAQSDNERILLGELEQQLMDVCLVVFTKP